MSSEPALVVLTDGPRCAAFHLRASTCLNQLAEVASFIDASISIAITYGNTEAKWKGQGLR